MYSIDVGMPLENAKNILMVIRLYIRYYYSFPILRIHAYEWMLVQILIATHKINLIVVVWACFTTSINLRQLIITVECRSTEFKIGGQFVRIQPFGPYPGQNFDHFYKLVKLLLSTFHIFLRHRHLTNWRCCEL